MEQPMLAMTKGFENKQSVTIYETEIITNRDAIEIAKSEGTPEDQIPEPSTKIVTYIRAGLPQGNSAYDGPIRNNHKKNFPETWKAFEAGQEKAGQGTHLSELPKEIMSHNLLNEYSSRGIESIEQLVSIDDNSIGSFPKGVKTREAAKKYLSIIREDMVEETASKVDELMDDFSAFKEDSNAKIEALMAENEALKKNQKAKPGPKPKEDNE
jgi:hypothetical protein